MKNICPSFLILLLLLLGHRKLFAQVTEDGSPVSIAAALKPLRVFEVLSISNTAKQELAVLNARHDSTGIKSFQFAVRKEVSYNPANSGQWDETAYGRVWRLGIHGAQAYSLYLTLRSFKLNNQAKLYVYGANYSGLKGAITEKNNNAANRLATAPITGDSLIVELDIPKGVQDYGRLQIEKVYLDVAGLFKKYSRHSIVVPSNSCDQNINCENGIYWQTDKRAVCKIVTDGALSTGTLVGNTAKDSQPYLLTSAHTMFDDVHAAESVFLFNYEYDCNKTVLNDEQTVSGASFIGLSSGLDYALIKLNQVPPASFRPYYAGWDIREVAPAGGVCIHHPKGAYKQIAIYYHPLTSDRFGEAYLQNSAWKVERWDIGSTEPGSSGSPLFNQQHRVVGSLTGGYSSCASSGSDFFNKLSLSWQGNILKPALDAANTGDAYIDGYDPYGFNLANCDTITNIKASEQVAISSSGLAHGYISGQNSSGTTLFAEKFTAPSFLLVPGVYLNVARLTYANAASHIELKIWEGSETPGPEIYSQSVRLQSLKNGKNYVMLDSTVKVSGNFFIGYQVNYVSPADTFAVYHAANRGYRGASSMYVFNGSWRNINAIAPARYSTSLAISVTECYGRSYVLKKSFVQLYPNPTSNYINIGVPAGTLIDDVTCFDMLGRKHAVVYQPSEVANRVFFNLIPGVYLLSVKSGGQQFVEKFVVQGP